MHRRRSVLALLAALALLLSLAVTSVSAQRAAVFRISLTGAAEAPGPGDPDATGEAIVVVIPATDTVCYLARWAGIDGTVFAAHIHQAPAGAPGGVVVTLFSGATFEGTGMTRGCVSGEGWTDDIVANPSGFYVNIHSMPNFPGGAIRGQLA